MKMFLIFLLTLIPIFAGAWFIRKSIYYFEEKQYFLFSLYIMLAISEVTYLVNTILEHII